MARPDGPVELMRELAAAASSAAHHQHIRCQIERHLDCGRASPVGRRSYAGKGLQRLSCPGGIIEDVFGQAGRNARSIDPSYSVRNSCVRLPRQR
jgi:hypothetical protein